jgi:hypothetical protein
MDGSWDNSNKFPKIDFTVVRYEVSFQDRVTDQYFACRHAHDSIKEAVACLYNSKKFGAIQPNAVVAVSGGYYRELTPEEDYRVAKASRRFIV